MKQAKAIGKLATAGVPEECKTLEITIEFVADFFDHVQQNPVIANVIFDKLLEAIAIPITLDSCGKEGAKDDAIVPPREIRKGIAIFSEGTAGTVGNNDQSRLLPGWTFSRRRICAVGKTGVLAGGENRTVFHIVNCPGAFGTECIFGQFLFHLLHVTFRIL